MRPWHSKCSQSLVYFILSCVRTRLHKNSLKSIWLRARSRMASYYTQGFLTTQHDFGGVLGQGPLDTFFWALTMSWSRLLAHVWSGPFKLDWDAMFYPVRYVSLEQTLFLNGHQYTSFERRDVLHLRRLRFLFLCCMYYLEGRGRRERVCTLMVCLQESQEFNHMIGGTLKLGPFKRNLELLVCPMLLRILICNLTHCWMNV
jgi:hypothetical protein